MKDSVLSFLKAEWKVSDTGSTQCWASSFVSKFLIKLIPALFKHIWPNNDSCLTIIIFSLTGGEGESSLDLLWWYYATPCMHGLNLNYYLEIFQEFLLYRFYSYAICFILVFSPDIINWKLIKYLFNNKILRLSESINSLFLLNQCQNVHSRIVYS